MFVYFTKQDIMINMNNFAVVQLCEKNGEHWIQFNYVNSQQLGAYILYVPTKENGYHIINRILEARKNGEKAITI